MRIALIDPGAYTPPYDDRLAAALAARGHDVHLLTAPFRFAEVRGAEGYERHELFFPLSSRLFRRAPRSRARLPLKAVEYASGARALKRELEAIEPDVVHLQWLFRRPDLDLRWLRPLTERWPTVFTAHDLSAMIAGRLAHWLQVFDAVDRVVVHSLRGVGELAALGVPRERIERIPHPVFAGRTAVTDSPSGSTLLFFGLIRAYKGLDLAIRALPAIARDVPGAKLVIAGDPVEPVEPLQELAVELGVADRIEWRLGYQDDEATDTLMAGSAVVMLPYRERVDSSGVLASALGHGRPAVVTDVGNLGETVAEFGAGAVVPPEDVDELAAACSRLLTDEAALREAFEGTRAACAALSWDASAEQHERLYEAVANRSLSSA
ncbi:MAG: glycosyltransferase family 4 protein [Actinomycetota bacterium]|nr:glycosyltransferase family 4 protein [Actinomycetota bacterium]